MQTSPANTLFFSYKNVVFPAQAGYSYFSVAFRRKLFWNYSQIIAYGISALGFQLPDLCSVLPFNKRNNYVIG